MLKIERELSQNEMPKFSSQDRIAANRRCYFRHFLRRVRGSVLKTVFLCCATDNGEQLEVENPFRTVVRLVLQERVQQCFAAALFDGFLAVESSSALCWKVFLPLTGAPPDCESVHAHTDDESARPISS